MVHSQRKRHSVKRFQGHLCLKQAIRTVGRVKVKLAMSIFDKKIEGIISSYRCVN